MLIVSRLTNPALNIKSHFELCIGLHMMYFSYVTYPTPVLLPGKSHGQRSLVVAVHGVTEGQTRLSDFTFTFHFHALEEEMATHSSALAWRIPGTGEPGGLPSMGSHRVGHDWSNLAAATAAVSSSFLDGETEPQKVEYLAQGNAVSKEWTLNSK